MFQEILEPTETGVCVSFWTIFLRATQLRTNIKNKADICETKSRQKGETGRVKARSAVANRVSQH